MKNRLMRQNRLIKKTVDLSSMQPLKGDEGEVKEGREFKILTLIKLITRFPILLTQIKAGNKSYKLKNEIRQVLLFWSAQ